MGRGMKSKRKQHAEPGRGPEWAEFCVFLLKLAVLVFAFRTFLLTPFHIPSESMQPKLMVGDYLLVAKWPYGFSKASLPFEVPKLEGRLFPNLPERGDVVVFKAPPGQGDDYIKRVIGLPGDTVQMKGGELYLNGRKLPRRQLTDHVHPRSPNSPCYASENETIDTQGAPVCRYEHYVERLPNGRSYRTLDLVEGGAGDDTALFSVPDGHMFLMGDNRDRSADSRFPALKGDAVGIVPLANLVGRALVIVYSTDGSADWLDPRSWLSAARTERVGQDL